MYNFHFLLAPFGQMRQEMYQESRNIIGQNGTDTLLPFFVSHLEEPAFSDMPEQLHGQIHGRMERSIKGLSTTVAARKVIQDVCYEML